MLDDDHAVWKFLVVLAVVAGLSYGCHEEKRHKEEMARIQKGAK